MATITIRQGDSDTLTETITGLSSLSGYTAKLYIYSGRKQLAKISGIISGLTIAYSIVNESSKLWATGDYTYETKIFDSSDHVYTPSSGQFIISETINKDPS